MRGASEISQNEVGVARVADRSRQEGRLMPLFGIDETQEKLVCPDMASLSPQTRSLQSNIRYPFKSLQGYNSEDVCIYDSRSVPDRDVLHAVEGRPEKGGDRSSKGGGNKNTRCLPIPSKEFVGPSKEMGNEGSHFATLDHSLSVRGRAAHAGGGHASRKTASTSPGVPSSLEVGPKRKISRIQVLHHPNQDRELHGATHPTSRESASLSAPLQFDDISYTHTHSSLPTERSDELAVRTRSKRARDPHAYSTRSPRSSSSSSHLSRQSSFHENGGAPADRTEQAPTACIRRVISELKSNSVDFVGKEFNDPRKSLEQILPLFDGASVKEEMTEVKLELKILPGASASWPAVAVRGVDGLVKVIRPQVRCVFPLAKVAPHDLNIALVHSTLSETGEDPVLKDLIERFIFGNEKQRKGKSRASKVSRDFLLEDIDVLREAKLVREPNDGTILHGALKCFKVAKKDGFARFITDCRDINALYNEKISMDMMELETIIGFAEKFSVVWSTDADAFFFQFRLSEKASTLFPIKLCNGRGSFTNGFLQALPMGFTYAPAIAQRTSNMIIRRTQKWIDEQRIEGKVAAWIDNYLVFSKSTEDAERVMETLFSCLKMFNVKCKPVDKSGEFLGLKSEGGNISLTLPFVDRARKAFSSFKSLVKPTYNDFLIVFGHVLWANTTIIRRPLCFAPESLQCIRCATSDIKAEISQNTTLICEELNFWFKNLHKPLQRLRSAWESRIVWSDATPNSLGFVIEVENKDFIASAKVEPALSVFDAELIAAMWAARVNNTRARHRIDNSAVTYALSKGHTLNRHANVAMQELYKENTPQEVGWVSTLGQRADGPSRGEPPGPRQVVSPKILPSYFF